jgi:hypothetical protein
VFEHLFVGFGVDIRPLVQFLLHQVPDDVEQALALGVLCLLVRKLFGIRRRIVHH